MRSISYKGIALPRLSPMLAAFAALLVTLFVATYPAKGAGIEDGFYSSSDDPSTQVVTNQNGQEIRLGQKNAPQILEATIFSRDNANTRFDLSVTIPNEGNEAKSIYFLAIGGKTYARNGWGSNVSSSDLSFPFSGDDNAKEVAHYFGVPINYRKHPAFNLLVTFTPSKPAFEVGEPVEVTMRIQNVGSNAFAFQFGGRNRAARDCQYSFLAIQASLGGTPLKDIGSDVYFGGLSVDRVVKPAEVFTNTVVLNKWFAFDKPGTYQILGSYYLAFKRMDKVNAPGRTSWEPVWEDYATADFTVKIAPSN